MKQFVRHQVITFRYTSTPFVGIDLVHLKKRNLFQDFIIKEQSKPPPRMINDGFIFCRNVM